MVRIILIFLASGAGSGFLPYAPGTFGSLVGMLVYFLFIPFSPPLYFLTTATIFFLAVWVAGLAEVIFCEKDSPKIVIDEVAGYLISLSFLSPTYFNILGGFLFFRLFDIIKPIPINLIHRRLSGGWAVALDDALAGLYVNSLLQLINVWGKDYPHLAKGLF